MTDLYWDFYIPSDRDYFLKRIPKIAVFTSHMTYIPTTILRQYVAELEHFVFSRINSGIIFKASGKPKGSSVHIFFQQHNHAINFNLSCFSFEVVTQHVIAQCVMP